MSSPHLAVRTTSASSSDADLHLARGADLLHRHGDLAGARACFERAYHLAHAAGEPELLAAAALGEGGLWVHERRRAADAARVVEHQEFALAQLDPSSPVALRLRVRLAAEAAYRSGDPGAVLALVDQIRRRGDPHAVAHALSLAHHCLLGPQHAPARLALAEELLRVAARTHRPGDVLIGLLWRAVDLFLSGNRHADRGYAELVDAERSHPHAAAHYVIMAIRVMLSIRAGRLSDAEELALACLRCGDAAGDEDATGWYGAHLFAIRWYQGRAAEAGVGVAEIAGSPMLSAVDHAFVAAQAVASAVAGDRRQARGALARLCGRDLGGLPRSSSWLPALCGVVETAALLGERDTAARAYRLLRPFGHLPAMGSLAIVCFGSVEQVLGVAALTIGDPDLAVAHLRCAVAQNEALGHWPAVAFAKARLAQALAVRGDPGDEASCERLAAESAAEAAAMGIALPRVPSGSAAPPPIRGAECTRQGRRWRIAVNGRFALVDDSVGLRYLATLIANPGVDVPALQLAASGGSPRRQAPAGAPQQVLDQQAITQYRTRLQGLREQIEQIEQAEALGSADRADLLRSEAEWLVDELQAQTGLGGRPRQFADDGERARIAVGKAIRRALRRVAAADPVIGAELRDAVQTGMLCCYRPRYQSQPSNPPHPPGDLRR